MGKQNNDGMTPNSGFQQSYNPYGSVPPLNNDSVYQNSNFGAYPTAQPQGFNCFYSYIFQFYYYIFHIYS